MAPSSTNGAVMPRCRRPPTKVIVFQCPCGIAVLLQVSSMNTSRAGSNMPCSRIQRRRARATSARFCSAAYRVFFEADVAASEEPPHRAAAACDPAFAHRRDDLLQRQVRLVGNQTQPKLRVLLQRRGAAAAWLC